MTTSKSFYRSVYGLVCFKKIDVLKSWRQPFVLPKSVKSWKLNAWSDWRPCTSRLNLHLHFIDKERTNMAAPKAIKNQQLFYTYWQSSVQLKIVSMRSEKNTYALHPVCQKFPQCRLWNGSSVCLIDDGQQTHKTCRWKSLNIFDDFSQLPSSLRLKYKSWSKCLQ